MNWRWKLFACLENNQFGNHNMLCLSGTCSRFLSQMPKSCLVHGSAMIVVMCLHWLSLVQLLLFNCCSCCNFNLRQLIVGTIEHACVSPLEIYFIPLTLKNYDADFKAHAHMCGELLFSFHSLSMCFYLLINIDVCSKRSSLQFS